MKRKGSMTAVVLLVPGCLITLIGLLYFFLKRGRGDRVTYLAIVLFTEIIFLVLISSLMPTTNSIPFINWLFFAHVLLLALMTVLALLMEKLENQYKFYKRKLNYDEVKTISIKPEDNMVTSNGHHKVNVSSTSITDLNENSPVKVGGVTRNNANDKLHSDSMTETQRINLGVNSGKGTPSPNYQREKKNVWDKLDQSEI